VGITGGHQIAIDLPVHFSKEPFYLVSMPWTRNFFLLFATRIIRLFAYGLLSVVLALYLSAIGLSEAQIGLLFTVTLAGDAGVSLWITTVADRLGRRRMLLVGSLLMLLAGIAFLYTNNPWLLALAAIIGVMSPSGNEIGPFLSIEQASLSHIVPHAKRTHVFAWYNLVGSFATAFGALSGGWISHALQVHGATELESYRILLFCYAIAGVLLALLFLLLTSDIEIRERQVVPNALLGLHKSRKVVFKLSGLFALDAFAGGFILQSLVAFWFHTRFGVDAGVLGSIFFGANVLAGISALLAVPMAKRFGLVNTMVFTHIPSNVLLILVPLMPNLASAIVVLMARFAISQMDVPTRQSYVMAVVDPDERSAASGVTAMARSVGAAASPSLSGLLFGSAALLSAPFFICGGLKIVYDLLLYREFKAVKAPEEK